MTAKLLSEEAFTLINQYKNFNIGFAVCPVPYYNNKRMAIGGGLKAQVGKGSPHDIIEELETVSRTKKINLQAVDSLTLKKILVDNNLGIDCSGFAYHVLNEESIRRGSGSMKDHISYVFARNFFRRLRAKMHPEKNTDVATLAHDKNSRIVALKEIEPGDMITMVGGGDESDRDHVLVVHEVNMKEDIPVAVSYTHSVAWPTDGEYGHGVRQGIIRITDASKPITEQEWVEAARTENENYTFARALKARTEIRRLNWL